MCCQCASRLMFVQQEDDSTSLFWVTVRVLMFLLPFLMLLRVVTAMREICLNRNSTGHAADHSFAAILWVSASMTCLPQSLCLCALQLLSYCSLRRSILLEACISLRRHCSCFRCVLCCAEHGGGNEVRSMID